MTTESVTTAMSPEMLEQLERLETVASWLGKPGVTTADVISQIIQTYGAEKSLSRDDARLIVDQAREYLAMGVKQHRDAAASKYMARLEWLLRTVAQHLVSDEVERTSMGPEPVAGQNGQAAVAPGGRQLKVKVKSKVLNVGAGGLALKIMKEIAVLSGARSGLSSLTLNQTNNNVNLPGARSTSQMGADELARYLTGALAPMPTEMPIIDGELAANPAPPGDGPADPAPAAP